MFLSNDDQTLKKDRRVLSISLRVRGARWFVLLAQRLPQHPRKTHRVPKPDLFQLRGRSGLAEQTHPGRTEHRSQARAWRGGGDVSFPLPFGRRGESQRPPWLASHLLALPSPCVRTSARTSLLTHRRTRSPSRMCTPMCFVFGSKTLRSGQRLLNLPEPNRTHLSDYYNGKIMFHLQKCSRVQSNKCGFLLLFFFFCLH